MDALTAVLTDGFNASKWTDQEVGIAIGRDILVIPIAKDIDPYGFIGKYQALKVGGWTVRKVAQALFETISTHPKSRTRYAETLVNQLANSSDVTLSERLVELIGMIENFPANALEKLREATPSSSIIFSNSNLLGSLQEIYLRYGVARLEAPRSVSQKIDDEIPF